MQDQVIGDVWYPGTDYIEQVTMALVPILFPNYRGGVPDFQYKDGDKGRGLLESALASPMPYFGRDRYPTIAEKAAVLIWSITKNHPFLDGNKRAALTTGFSFLVNNYYVVLAGQDEAVTMCLGIADNSVAYEIPFVVRWIQERIVPVETIMFDEPDVAMQERVSRLSSEKTQAWATFYRIFASTMLEDLGIH